MLDSNDILKALSDIIIVIDNNHNIIYSNSDTKQWINLIKNKHIGEIYVTEQDKWYNVNSKKIIKDDKKYSVFSIRDITKYKLKEQLLQIESLTDPLTGLYNRKGIIKKIDKAIKIFEKTNKPFAIIIGDIDHFKKINDVYGHAAGDMVLVRIGGILKQSLRESDSVGRYGGEEFIIVLKSDKIDQIYKRIEQIKNAIQETLFMYEKNVIKVTMTFGIQLYDGTKTIEQVISEADSAMYDGKNKGRSEIVIFDKKNKKMRNGK